MDFCIDILAELDICTTLDECSSEQSDWPSIDMARGKTQTMLNWPDLWQAAKLMVGALVGRKQKRPVRGVFIG